MPVPKPTDEQVRNQYEGHVLLMKMANSESEFHIYAITVALCNWFLGGATEHPPTMDIAKLTRDLAAHERRN